MSGTTPWQSQANVEPIASVTIEAIANAANFATVSGCAASYSGVNMQVTVASGVILHTGVPTQVAGNTVTLVSDPTNPRWTYRYINSSGVAAIISGSPAATPAVPDPGANPTNGLDYVQAGLTVATNATYKLDKRVFSEMSAQQEFVGIALPAGYAVGGGFVATANRAMFVPMLPLTANVTCTSLIWSHAVASGNYDIGIYSWDGTTMTRVVSLGSTASPAIGAARVASDITDTPLTRGIRYFFALASDNGTEQPVGVSVTTAVVTNLGYLKATSFPLPATVTALSVATVAQVPVIFGNITGGITL